MKRIRRDKRPWYVPPPPPGAAVFRCRGCRAAVTGPLARLGDPAALAQEAGAPLVPAGHFWPVPAGQDFAGQFAVGLAELAGVGYHPDRRRLAGCCGPGGDAGPNRVCACGREVGTERSDCIYPKAVYLDSAQVLVEAQDPGPGPALDPRWRTADVLALARGIAADRAWGRLPLLADALMDAGCADEDILGHCRRPDAVRGGSWVVDQLLRPSAAEPGAAADRAGIG